MTERVAAPVAVRVWDGVVVGLALSDCVGDLVRLPVGVCEALDVGLEVEEAVGDPLAEGVLAPLGDVVWDALPVGLGVSEAVTVGD